MPGNDTIGGAARSRVNAAAVIARWPRRYVVVTLTFLGCLIAFTDRVNISVAAVAMKEHFGWSQTQKGFVLAAFFVGYLLFMFAAGLLAQRFGGKRVLGYSVLAWSIFTLLTTPAATLSIAVLIAVRIAMGIGEAGMFPATYELFGRWVPPTERTRAVAFMTSGVPVGTLIVTPDRQAVLVDAGFPGNDDRDPKRIMAAIHDAGVSRLDYLVLTHFHQDHIGGVPAIAAQFPIGAIVDHDVLVDTDRLTLAAFQSYEPVRGESRVIHPKAGDRLPLGGLRRQAVR